MAHSILIVSANMDDYSALQAIFAAAGNNGLSSQGAEHMAAAMACLKHGNIDAVLLDLSLPDSQGLETFIRLHARAPGIPIMVLCESSNESLAIQALHLGAKGYLLREQLMRLQLALSQLNPLQHSDDATEQGLERAQMTLDSIADAVIGTDLHGHVDYMNLAAESLTGWQCVNARGLPINQVMPLINDATRAPYSNPVERLLRNEHPTGMKAGTLLVHMDGSTVAIEDSVAPIRDPTGQMNGAVIVFRDVTEVRAMAMKMAYLAQHDTLTQLPNRTLLSDRIDQAINLARRSGNAIALMFLDLDRFKQINDSLGHAIGDQLLQCVSRRLSSCVRTTDTVSRIGGDEFVILLAAGRDMQDAGVAAQKILQALALPCQIGQQQLHITCSIGISVYPNDAEDAETLLKNADTAMYHAKEIGRNGFQFFRDDMNARAVARQSLETSLGQALANNEWQVLYQPKFNLRSGAITGAEALLRWQHPLWGLTLPERFLPAAESCGLMLPLGQWVLREACLQLCRWDEQGITLGSIAVNISALEFHHPDLVSGVRQVLLDTALQPARLQLEITENILMHDAAASLKTLVALKAIGIQLAIDKFGTGFSSLNYLLGLPIDVLKIDKSFVQAITAQHDPDNGIVASAVIAMGGSLGLEVVAEGIENPDQLAFLNAAQCQEGQGYLCSQGLPHEHFARLVQMRA